MSTMKWVREMRKIVNADRGLESLRLKREGGMRFSSNQKGFTLVEMLTVVAIIGILSSVAIPSFHVWLHKYRADSEATRLYFNLMASKQRAIRNNSTVIVTFSPGTNSYSIHDDINENGAADVGENVDQVFLDPDSNMIFGAVPGLLGVWGAAVTNPVSLNGSTSVSFFSAGRADRSGAIYLIPSGDLPIAKKENQRAIKIIQATGNLEVMKFTANGSPGPWS